MFEAARIAEERPGEVRLTVEQTTSSRTCRTPRSARCLRSPADDRKGLCGRLRPNPGRLVKDLVSCTAISSAPWR